MEANLSNNENDFQEVANEIKTLNEGIHMIYPTSSRYLANIAGILLAKAIEKSSNGSFDEEISLWSEPLDFLKIGSYKDGKALLLQTCQSLIKNMESMGLYTASKNYERASHIMISKQVETANAMARSLFEIGSSNRLSVGQVVQTCCPARLDLSGGWTDTPPICYEYGGAVTNIAITVNGLKPLGCKASFIESLVIRCTLVDMDGSKCVMQWTHLDDLRDYDNPLKSGTLIKASIVYSGLVNLKSNDSLEEQLKDRFNAGVDLTVWTYLAHGSGLGGSSILAGGILATLSVLLTQREPSVGALIHAVLGVEQLMTTGGGWQDQVGSLLGGAKLGVSRRNIPLIVELFNIPISDKFLNYLNGRLLIIYTGKVRLARGLLQNVIRNWYSRDANIVACFTELRKLALKAADAMIDEDAKLLGECMTNYWNLKNKVAGSEDSEKLRNLRLALHPVVFGQCLAGAGGGGYLYALTKDHLDDRLFSEMKALVGQFEGMILDKAEIDVGGISISVDGVYIKPKLESVRNINKDDWKNFWVD